MSHLGIKCVRLSCRHRFPMHSFHPAPIFLPIFPARCIIFPPPLFSVAQRIEWFISLVPSMFLSLTAQTFCKTLLLKHEQRTLVIMAKINDTFATIYLSSPKVIDVINQSQKCYTLKNYVITWIGSLHLMCSKDLRFNNEGLTPIESTPFQFTRCLDLCLIHSM